MSLWMKNGKLIANSTGNPIDCEEYCPCTEPVPPGPGPDPGPGPTPEEDEVIQYFANIIQLDSGSNIAQSIPIDRGHQGITGYLYKDGNSFDIIQTRDRDDEYKAHLPVSAFFIPKDYYFMYEKHFNLHWGYNHHDAYYLHYPLTYIDNKFLVNIPLIKEQSLIYRGETPNFFVISSNNFNTTTLKLTKYNYAGNVNNINITFTFDINKLFGSLISTGLINNCDNDFNITNTKQKITILTSLFKRGDTIQGQQVYPYNPYGEPYVYYLNLPPAENNKHFNYGDETIVFNSKVYELKQFYLERIITGTNLAYGFTSNTLNNSWWGSTLDLPQVFLSKKDQYLYFYNDNYTNQLFKEENGTYSYFTRNSLLSLDSLFYEIHTFTGNVSDISSCKIEQSTEDSTLYFTYGDTNFYIYKKPSFGILGMLRVFSDNYKIISGTTLNNIKVKVNNEQTNWTTPKIGYYIAYNSYFYEVKQNTTTHKWQFKDIYDNTHVLSGSNDSLKPSDYYYFRDGHNYFCKPINSGYLLSGNVGGNVEVVVPLFYDYKYRELLTPECVYCQGIGHNQANGYGKFLGNYQHRLISKDKYKDLYPFIRLKSYNYLLSCNTDSSNRYSVMSSTINEALNATNTRTIKKIKYNNISVGDSYLNQDSGNRKVYDIPLYNISDINYYNYQGGYNSHNVTFDIDTIMFEKMTASLIAQLYTTGDLSTYRIDPSLSTDNNYTGIYCEILTAVWAGPTNTKNLPIPKDGFRSFGIFNQVLEFGKEYNFALDIYHLNNLSTITPDPNYNTYSSISGSTYFNLNCEMSDFRDNVYFKTLFLVRPISTVTTIPSQTDHNLYPIALSTLTPVGPYNT